MSTKNDTQRTKEQLIEELTRLRKRITESEKLTTEQKMIEEKLKASEVRYRSYVEVTGQLGWVTNAQGEVEEDIASWRVYTGQSYEEVKGDGWAKALHPDDVENTAQIWQEAIKTKSPYEVEYRVRRKDGEYRWFITKALPVFKKDGTILEWVGTCIDITERKKIEEVLQESEQRFRSLVETTSDWVWEVDENGHYTYVSPKIKELLGYEPEEIIGKTPFDLMLSDEAKRMAGMFGDIVESQKPFMGLENINLHKDGQHIMLETNGVPIFDANGNLKGYRGIDRDITKRKQIEEQIRASLREKEILLKEIHHRVKNNLQIIYSLLSLQTKHLNDEQDKNLFRQAQDRIKTIALIHEKLHISPDFATIDFKKYLQNLSAHLLRSHGVASRIELCIEMGKITLDIDTAIPCSLVINELVTNSIKYAFPNSKKGRISIAFNMRKKEYVLSVADNGKGLPEDFDYRNTKSLGLQLVCALTEQLHGKITLGKNKGTKFTITFRKK